MTVSIIVPCYNVASYLDRFFESIIGQTHRQLEIIIVNDGSTDETLAGLRRYVPKLEECGFSVNLIDQQNRGLAGAVDTGLKYVSGEFLTWPDPDDWLTPDSIERRVELMREFPDAGLLRTASKLFIQKYDKLEGHIGLIDGPPRIVDNIFGRHFLGRTHYHPVCHFVRTEAFLATTGRSIHVAPGGNSQNLQMLLPLSERYPTIEAGDICAFYTVRDDSRSRRDVTALPKIKRTHMLLDNLLQTIPKLCGNHDQYGRVAEQAWLRNRVLMLAFEGNCPEEGIQVLDRCGFGSLRARLVRVLLRLKAKLFPHNNQITLEGQKAPLSSRAFLKLVWFNPDSVSLPLKADDKN
ncbi:glycosyltransferase family 2 protein [Coraliomargarita algicola]|uniref:Glycosyltransferase family 2 protein n=1 Tax=Coraliomargarita algicola TaxID=3092156 RepID=A0ABZ0RQ06_9BACT|nr:glycosyltransferase family 2 protein [Coraliomargarita sp. J2-16]WPJ94999.1 glycosyltransferase family 2 protein [Coraliomargarita sp. J2-16]